MKTLLKYLIFTYRYTFSALIGGQCRFYPSCSEYALDALETFTWLRALQLIVRRIVKCHPWHLGGVDLVPSNARHPLPHSVSDGAQERHENTFDVRR